MTRPNLNRTLWYEDRDKTIEVETSFLSQSVSSLVILGEAGMGKTTLLSALAAEMGWPICTARKLINTPEPASLIGDSPVLIIDALDEVSAAREGDAVDLVMQRLAQLNYPRFVLSCRVADWRSATALQGFRDHYSDKPLELHLNPLQRLDAVSFLAGTIGSEEAETTVSHLENNDLQGLWKNPQTLELVERVAAAGNLPASKGDLFARAVTLLRAEHREEKAATTLASLPESEVLDAAGAAFASLVVGGYEALSRKVTPDVGDISIAEVSGLPMAQRLPDVLSARLFESRGSERFIYGHRAIGEFLGAKWLASQATTRRKQRRMLALFHSNSLVPASLRGVHAWLAWHNAAIATDVIRADPMGIIEYGDADNLTVEQGRELLLALGRLSKENPNFREWGPYRVRGIVQKPLLFEISRLLTEPATEFGLRLLILQALKDSALTGELVEILHALVLDQNAYYANRSEAGDRLAELKAEVDWPKIIEALLRQADENAVRLALEMMTEVGLEEFDTPLIARAVYAQANQADHHVGAFYVFERKVPDSKLDELLDLLAARVVEDGKPEERMGDHQLTDLAYGLLARRLPLGAVEKERLWLWIEPFESQHGYHRETREVVAQYFLHNSELRRAVQKHALLDVPGDESVWQRSWKLAERSPGLMLKEEDVLALFEHLHPYQNDDDRWKDVVQLAPHKDGAGGAVRAAAKLYVNNDPALSEWIDLLAEDRVYEWQIAQAAKVKERQEKREAEWAAHRADAAANLEHILAGSYGAVVGPAQAYLKLYHDVGDKTSSGKERIAEWLGDDLAEFCLRGFEAFLNATPAKPTAEEMAESYANGKRWTAEYIIVAALAERHRRKAGFNDLSDERITAGLITLFQTSIDDHAGLVGLEEALVNELKMRASWESALRLYFEPQFARKLEHVQRLYNLVHDEVEHELAAKLAAEWLMKFPQMAAGPECELIDLLLRAGNEADLYELQKTRLTADGLSDERKRNWQAVALLVDFQNARSDIEAASIEKTLLWHIRARSGDRRRDQRVADMRAEQLYWIIEVFRPLFPMEKRPATVTTGDTNSWDGYEYLAALITRLGNFTSDEAIEYVRKLRDASEDGYTYNLRVIASEQRRKRIEADFRSPQLDDIRSAVSDTEPTNSLQLRVVLLEELRTVQAKIRGSDVDWYKDFFDGRGIPHVEEHCRDVLIKMLGDLPFAIQAAPEGHLADEKRCDIVCTLGRLMVPIEVKGQWHKDLWKAADQQLDKLYSNDWRADNGIYLVLWFGQDCGKPIAKPPENAARPTTAEELLAALVEASSSARSGRTEIVVLDFTRP